MWTWTLLACLAPAESTAPEEAAAEVRELSASPRTPGGSTARPSQETVPSTHTVYQAEKEPELELTQTVLWGDPHAHSGMSADGCERADANCSAQREGAPGANMSEQAANNGLDWFALTDHVEFQDYVDLTTGQIMPIWDGMLDLVQRSQRESGVTLYAGYEWRDCSESGTHHRTVIFESPNACSDLRPPACPNAKRPKEGFGLEGYVRRNDIGRTTAQALAELLKGESQAPGCETRWVSFAHHSAYERPGSLDWDQDSDRMENEVLIEIFSEHGSSECIDLSAPGCDYYTTASLYKPQGSAQSALQAGQLVGFVGGTDSHDANPGSTEDGGGAVAKLVEDEESSVSKVAFQPAPGGVTAVLLPPGDAPYAGAVFDGLLARHTVASTVVLDGFELWVTDPMGQVYLPGDLLPVGTYRLHLSLPYDHSVQLINALGESEAVDDWFTVQRGQPRYLRIHFELESGEQRIWASPFFPL